jgi:hypothetical protein
MNIIFCSSLSSQLGANLALKSNGGENGFNIVIGINPEVNKYEQLSTDVDFTGKHCIRIHLNNKILSIIVPAILVTIASIIPINIKYYLPRPHWLRLDCFERFRAKDTVYYGDGFAHLCLTSAPFWINHHNYKKKELNFIKNALFIYCTIVKFSSYYQGFHCCYLNSYMIIFLYKFISICKHIELLDGVISSPMFDRFDEALLQTAKGRSRIRDDNWVVYY